MLCLPLAQSLPSLGRAAHATPAHIPCTPKPATHTMGRPQEPEDVSIRRYSGRQVLSRARRVRGVIAVGPILSLVVLWSLTASSSWASAWYVDNTASSSANTGDSWQSAWTNFDSVVWGSGGVSAGDTLYISGGTTAKIYTNTWAVGTGGTSNNPIRIALDATNSQHNGLVIFDYDFAGDNADFRGITCSQDYVIFNGSVGGDCHLVVSNLRNYRERNFGIGIFGDGTTGVVIDHVASTNCNNPIRLQYSTGFRISNCNLAQVRGDAAIALPACTGSWDANVVCSNLLEMLYNEAVPPGKSSAYVGPDGVQCDSGVSIFRNVFVEKITSVYTSDQHPDMIQTTGNYLKIYGNEFINIGDSAIDYDCGSNPNPHDVWIYNNLFRIIEPIDLYPEYFRLYCSFNSLSSINNFKILNNTFVDNPDWPAVRIYGYRASPVAGGNEIKNNLFYNCGNAAVEVIYIEDNCGFTQDSFAFDGNIYSSPLYPTLIYNGAFYSAAAWVSRFEPHGRTNAPAFVAYIPFDPSDDFHLETNDLAAVKAGVNLSAYFATDKDGVARGQSSAWDIGAYAYTGGEAGRSNLPPVISAIVQYPADDDRNGAGVQAVEGRPVQYLASAFAPTGDLLSWQWLYTVDDGPEVLYENGTGAVAAVSFCYPTGTAGSTYVWKLRVNNNRTAAESQLSVGVEASPVAAGELSFRADSGLVSRPFVVSDCYIYQPIDTDAFNRGRALYSFYITNAGDYIVAALVDAPTFGQRSFFVNVDSEPQDDSMAWTIPITVGFESRIVSWQGAGSCSSPELVPKIFRLAQGAHELIVRGREPNTKLAQISLWPLPEVSTGKATAVTDESATLSGSINPGGSEATAYFDYGVTTNYYNSTVPTSVGNGTTPFGITNTLQELVPGTQYHFRLASYNGGVTNFGEFEVFTTAPLRPPTLSGAAFDGKQFCVAVHTANGPVYYLESASDLRDSSWSAVTNVPGDGTEQLLTDPAAAGPQRFYRVRIK